MVSKVAVITLVVIVACPILLGYAMNLEETAHTEYKAAGNPIDMSLFLRNGDYYGNISAETEFLNTNIYTAHSIDDMARIWPLYTTSGGNVTSLPFYTDTVTDWAGGVQSLADMSEYYITLENDFAAGYVAADIYSNSVLVTTIDKITYLYYNHDNDSITYTYRAANDDFYSYTITGGQYDEIGFRLIDIATAHIYYGYRSTSGTGQYVDLSAGFRFSYNTYSQIRLPDDTRSYLMTINLDSVTDSSDEFFIMDAGTNNMYLKKTTTGDVVKWQAKLNGYDSDYVDLFYDSGRNDNTYQYYVGAVKKTDGEPYDTYDIHRELRYVGSWPTIMGSANTYWELKYDTEENVSNTVPGLRSIIIYQPYGESGGFTPIIRMDEALYRGMLYKVTSDQLYQPGKIKDNPQTTIYDAYMSGYSLTFGGNEYAVTDGNIILGTHQVSLRNLVLDSVPNVGGGYDNRINGNVVSNTPEPSDIFFAGNWRMNIKTDTLVATTNNTVDWTPGQFAWDGIDHNFLLVGLFTSFAAFIGIGIYMRRSKAALWPLLLVTGGAAFLFLIMM